MKKPMAAILQFQSRRVFRVIDPSPRSFPKMTSISRQSSGPLDYSSRNQCRLIFFSFKFDASFTQLRAKHKCIFPLKMSNPQNFLLIYGHILFLMPLSLRYIQPATMYIEHIHLQSLNLSNENTSRKTETRCPMSYALFLTNITYATSQFF